MTASRATPFPFEDFDPTPPVAAPRASPPPADIAADIERRLSEAYAAGLAAGAERAARAREIDAALALQALAATLAERCRTFESSLAAERARLRAATRTVLSTLMFERHEASARQAAIDLVDRLLKASADRAPARLTLSAHCPAQTVAALRDALAERNAADFISVDIDAELPPGDCSLSWRGGAAQRRFAVTRQEIRRILQLEDLSGVIEENRS